jgi:hypothetical protein
MAMEKKYPGEEFPGLLISRLNPMKKCMSELTARRKYPGEESPGLLISRLNPMKKMYV